MTKLIPAKCPSCGAELEFPEGMEVGHCMHCGGKVIIDKEVHVHGQTAIACPECGGKGYFLCSGKKRITASHYIIKSCEGTGKCNVKFNQNDKLRRFCNSGVCDACNGKGKIYGFACGICDGHKICPACNGSGVCTFCSGKGKIECKACKGTGFKIYKPK